MILTCPKCGRAPLKVIWPEAFGNVYECGNCKMVMTENFGGNMGKWTYFNDTESAGLVDDLMFKLDRTRGLFGYPMEITCGYRTPEHNAEIGGVPDSAHCKGMAVDLKPPSDSVMRERMVWALCVAGFQRVESAPKHFHVDVDQSKPIPCFWQGTDK